MLWLIHMLNDFRSWLFLVSVASLLAVAGIALFGMARVGAPYAIALAAPLYQLLLFRLGHAVFFRFCGRDPVDVAYSSQPGLVPDRVFAISYFLLSVFSVLGVIAPLIWGTSR